MLPPLVEHQLRLREPFFWLNERRYSFQERDSISANGVERMYEAEDRLRRFSSVLRQIFPELSSSRGIIESPLHSANRWAKARFGQLAESGRWLIKCDHALPITGSVKARGGIYEVLVHAEALGARYGIIPPDGALMPLITPEAQLLFGRHQIAVGSTGNLGLSVGVMASALGFRATVHMSSDAKAWKKARLRACGAEVVEHPGDYEAAVAAGRAEARHNPRAYFVDDENSDHLFFGYSVAALRLKEQLAACDIQVDAQHPLFVYLPCGVGGAPGGITFGLHHVFGRHVHCFFAEPVAAPCMLVRLASCADSPISVTEVGLDNVTEADGLAVGRASEFAANMTKGLVAGVFTVRDDDLFSDLYLLERAEGLRVEPSALAAFRGPGWLLGTHTGRSYLARCDLLEHIDDAAHVIWSSGGGLLPEEEYLRFHARGREASAAERKKVAESASG